jgi:hypothetical protein
MHPNTVLRRIKTLTWLFIIGLVLSGATAIPLMSEVDALAKAFDPKPSTAIGGWFLNVQTSLHSVNGQYPFLFYGTDWLAFGHFVIGIAFIGALRDPVRNQWLFTFGMISCALVIPYAFIFGAIRGHPCLVAPDRLFLRSLRNHPSSSLQTLDLPSLDAQSG